MDLGSKVVVVTGGGNGIGREVVLGLLERGARVAAVDLSETALAQTERLAGASDRLSTHTVDITDRDAVLALPVEVARRHGQIDGLVNVAGIIHDFRPIEELPFETIERVMGVNFWGTLNTVKAFLPVLRARPEAALVNVSSMGAYGPVPGQTAYGASKAAVRLLTEGLYAELLETNVAVTVVHPGGIATDITGNSGATPPPGTESMDPERQARIQARLTTPADAGRQIVEAVESGRPRLLIGNDARLLDGLMRSLPTRGIRLVKRQMDKLLAG